MVVPFNQQHYTGNELKYIQACMDSGRISGDGKFTAACQQFFEEKYHFKKTFLTSSCTDALEMAALLLR
ncbi:MAG: dTDP-4-amino-4,6-dideoxygalactose transaminase, partial [Bacteroidota bacterium]